MEPARRDRRRVHRRAGGRVQPHRRPRQGEVVLRRGRRRARLRRVHHAVPRQVRALELSEVPVRGELRDDPDRGADRRSRGAPLGGLQRSHPAFADLELRPVPRLRRRQPRAGPPVRARPADVRRDGLVPPQARGRRPFGPRGARRRGGALLARRVRARAPAGERAPGGRPRGDRREAPQVHEPADRLHPQGAAPDHRDGVREGAPGRRGGDDGAARLALQRARDGPVREGAQLRPLLRRRRLRLRQRLQRLRAQGPQVRRRTPVSSPRRGAPGVGLGAPRAQRPGVDRGPQRDGRPRDRDEVQPEPPRAARGRVLRPRHAVLPGLVRAHAPLHPRRYFQKNLETQALRVGPHVVYAIESQLHAPPTTTSPTSSAAPTLSPTSTPAPAKK